ncbi:MAG: YggS family pyridoxal phosphate-dependent enzyme [Desulfosalsimonadaceae bacterium]
METVAKRLERIREKIAEAALRSGRNPESVQIVGVTKTVPVERIAEAVRAGIRIFGENYVQESLQKMEALASPEISWHFIGRLQSNKARHAVLRFELIHSVHSEKLAREIDRQAARLNRVQPVLLQVNTGEETSKTGVMPNDAMDLVKRVSRLQNVSIRGLMTMPPFFDAPDRVRPFFRALHDLKKRITDAGLENISMEHLSMGMTGDFEVAVEEGATLVRIGTALFGKRQ